MLDSTRRPEFAGFWPWMDFLNQVFNFFDVFQPHSWNSEPISIVKIWSENHLQSVLHLRFDPESVCNRIFHAKFILRDVNRPCKLKFCTSLWKFDRHEAIMSYTDLNKFQKNKILTARDHQASICSPAPPSKNFINHAQATYILRSRISALKQIKFLSKLKTRLAKFEQKVFSCVCSLVGRQTDLKIY